MTASSENSAGTRRLAVIPASAFIIGSGPQA
jgi:hypothetical protein